MNIVGGPQEVCKLQTFKMYRHKSFFNNTWSQYGNSYWLENHQLVVLNVQPWNSIKRSAAARDNYSK
jgi:hypothetical protein